MAVTFRAASGGQSSTAALTASVTKPTGVLAGDLVLVAINIKNSTSNTFAAVAGWTLSSQDANAFNGTSNFKSAVYWRVLNGAESWPISFTWASTTAKYAWNAIAFTPGANQIGIDGEAAVVVDTAASATHTANAQTAVYSSVCSVILDCGRTSAASATAISVTPPTNWTEPTNGDQSTASGTTAALSQLGVESCYRTGQSGTVTPGVSTWSQSTVAANVYHFLLAEQLHPTGTAVGAGSATATATVRIPATAVGAGAATAAATIPATASIHGAGAATAAATPVPPWTAPGAFLYADQVTGGSGDLATNNQAVGDLLLVQVVNFTTPTILWCTGMSGGGATWVQLGTHYSATNRAMNVSLFAGTVTATGAGTASASWNGTAPVNWQMDGHEFSSSTGVWSLDALTDWDTASTANWASLTPSTGGELYWGAEVNSGSAVAGSTTGYVYHVNTGANGVAYNLSCPAGIATFPVWADTNTRVGIMAVVSPLAVSTATASIHGAGAVSAPITSPALELSGFGTFSDISPAATITSVAVSVGEFASNAGMAGAAIELWDGASAQIGATFTGAASTSSSNIDTATFTGVTYAQLATLRVRIYANRNTAATGVTESVDDVQLTVTYTQGAAAGIAGAGSAGADYTISGGAKNAAAAIGGAGAAGAVPTFRATAAIADAGTAGALPTIGATAAVAGAGVAGAVPTVRAPAAIAGNGVTLSVPTIGGGGGIGGSGTAGTVVPGIGVLSGTQGAGSAVGAAPLVAWRPAGTASGTGAAGAVPTIGAASGTQGAGVTATQPTIGVLAGIGGAGVAGAVPAIGASSGTRGNGTAGAVPTIGVSSSLTGSGSVGGQAGGTGGAISGTGADTAVPTIRVLSGTSGAGAAGAASITGGVGAGQGSGGAGAVPTIGVLAAVQGAGAVAAIGGTGVTPTAAIAGAGAAAAVPTIGAATGTQGQGTAGTVPTIGVLAAVQGAGAAAGATPAIINPAAGAVAGAGSAVTQPTVGALGHAQGSSVGITQPTIGVTAAVAGAGVAMGAAPAIISLAVGAAAGAGAGITQPTIGVTATVAGSGTTGGIASGTSGAIFGSGAGTAVPTISVSATVSGAGAAAGAAPLIIQPATAAIAAAGVAGAQPAIRVTSITTGSGAAAGNTSVSFIYVQATGALAGTGVVAEQPLLPQTASMAGTTLLSALAHQEASAALTALGVIAGAATKHDAAVPATGTATVTDPREGFASAAAEGGTGPGYGGGLYGAGPYSPSVPSAGQAVLSDPRDGSMSAASDPRQGHATVSDTREGVAAGAH